MIDIERIREYTGADDEFIATLLNKFLSHLNGDLELIREASAKEDWSGLRKLVHQMLSSARIFHLDEIVEVSQEIEVRIENGATSELHRVVEKLLKHYENFYQEACKWVKERSN